MGKLLIVAGLLFFAATAGASESVCKLADYKASPGLTAANEGHALVVTWEGQKGQELRLRFAIVSGTPTIQDISVRAKGGAWTRLAEGITPRVSRGDRPPSTGPGSLSSS